MNKTILFAAMVLCIFTGCYARDTKALSQTKENVVNPYLWDLGTVAKGQTIQRVFIFNNASARTVTITSVNTSCGCTGSRAKDTVLAPGASTEITVQFDSKGYPPQALTQFIYVNTDDPENPVIKFTVKVEVVG
jgi:hypothetical protein